MENSSRQRPLAIWDSDFLSLRDKFNNRGDLKDRAFWLNQISYVLAEKTDSIINPKTISLKE